MRLPDSDRSLPISELKRQHFSSQMWAYLRVFGSPLSRFIQQWKQSLLNVILNDNKVETVFHVISQTDSWQYT